MKAFVALFALVALVAADADPQWLGLNPLLYNNWAVERSPGMVKYANGAEVPMDTASVAIAKMNHLNTKALTYASRWGMGLPLAIPAVNRIFKREADAEADPQLLTYANTWANPWMNTLGYRTAGLPIATSPLGYRTALPLATTAYRTPLIASSPLISTLGYSRWGLPAIRIAEKKEEEKKDDMIVSVEKRDADAESQWLLPNTYAGNLWNTAPVASPLAYSGLYNGMYSGLYNGMYNTLYNGMYNTNLLANRWVI